MVEDASKSERRSRLGWIAERDPDRALALLAAPPAARDALALLFALDLRLGAIADRQGEPAAAMLRLAWWRDALAALNAAPSPPEPMLREIAELLLRQAMTGGELARIAEGWMALLEEDDGGEAAIEEHAGERGSTLFILAARLCGGGEEDMAATGAAWALAERARHGGDAERLRRFGNAATARFAALGQMRWPRRLRALGTLAVLARHDLARGHRRSAGSRLFRALRHRLTGR